eukprot:1189212-Prorocentrum_minimum.AAC.4
MQAEDQHDGLLADVTSAGFGMQPPHPMRGLQNLHAASTSTSARQGQLSNSNPLMSSKPSLHYDEQYLTLRKSYSYWHEQKPTSEFASKAQNEVWETAARTGTPSTSYPNVTRALTELSTTYNPAGLTAVHLAAIKSNISMLQQIAQACGAGTARAINTPTQLPLNGSPLHWAAAAGNLDACATLIELGADVDSRDMFGTTPLMAACVHQHPLVVCMLILRGAQVELGDECQATALHWAAHADCRDACSILVQAGAPWEACDKFGQTPLHATISRSGLQCAQYLMWVGANPDKADTAGWTPRLMAKWRRYNMKKLGAKRDSSNYKLEIFMWTVGAGGTQACGDSSVSLDTSPRSRYIPGRSRIGAWAVLSNKLFGYYVYVSRVAFLLHDLPGTWGNVLMCLQAIQVPLHLLLWFFYYKTRESSGELEYNQAEYRRVVEKLGDSSQPSALVAWRDFCHVCQLIRPRDTKTKHCSICMRCVPGQDHHCTLLDRCVGNANRWYFIGYTASVSLTCSIFCVLLDAASRRMPSALLSATFWDFVVCVAINMVLLITQMKLYMYPRSFKPHDEALRI